MPADVALNRIFKQHPQYGSRDRRLYSLAVFAWFRWLGWTRRLTPGHASGQLAWALWLDGADETSTLPPWPEVTEGPPPPAVKPASLAELARVIATTSAIPDLRVADLFPDWLPLSLDPAIDADAFMAACQQRPPTWLHLPEPARDACCEALRRVGLKPRTHARIPGAVAIDPPFQLQVIERAWGQPLHVQDIASQAVGLVSQATPGSCWWDVCCGAGGKTLLLAEAVGHAGRVMATDCRDTILENLRERAARHRRSNILTQLHDATLPPPFHHLCDGVLVDAPCSGIGTWPRNPDARWRTPNGYVETCTRRQIDILRQAATRVKPGGVLVYAVCSVTRAEGPDIVAEFTRETPAFHLEPFVHPYHGDPTPGYAALAPADGPGDGMFVARFRRASQ